MNRLLSGFTKIVADLIKVMGWAATFAVLLSSLNGLSLTPASAASLTPEADYYQVPGGNNNRPQQDENVDLEKGANRAESAADNIYKGLDTTKDVVGKTEQRNRVIESAREQASDRLKLQSERAKSAENPELLDPNERHFLKHIQ